MIRLSTGLRNFIADGGSVKKALEDGVMMIYTGTQPTSADTGVGSSTKLVEISKQSATFSFDVPSTPKVAYVGISGTPANNASATITINGVGYSITQQTGDTLNIIARKLAFLLTNKNKVVFAVPIFTSVGGTSSYVAICSKHFSDGFTISVGSSSGVTLTLTDDVITQSDSNGLNFATASNGVLLKASDIWSGVAIANGTAGWFRFYGNTLDTGATDTTGTVIRLDGSVGTVSADLIVTSTNIVSGATITVDSCSLTIPAF